jgi:hypothetical protein
VEVAGAGRLVLDVDSGGGYSLRAYPEGSEDPSRELLAVGVVHADEIVAIHPEGLSAVDGEQGGPTPRATSQCVKLQFFLLPLFTQVIHAPWRATPKP